jgi:hypothetical protein
MTFRKASLLLGVVGSTLKWIALAFLLAALGVALGHTMSLELGIALAGLGGLFLLPTMDGYCQLLADEQPLGLWVLRGMLALSLVVNLAAALGLLPAQAEVQAPADTFSQIGLMGWGVGGSLAMILALLRPRR